MARFDRQAVIEAIRQLSRDGMMPTSDAYKAYRKEHGGLAGYTNVMRRMGPWKAIAEGLGLRLTSECGWTDDELIELAKELSEDIKPRIITAKNWNLAKPKDAPTSSTIRVRFGGWREFAKACGLKTFIRWEDEPIVTSSSTSAPIPIRPREPMLNERFMVDNFKPFKRV